MSYASDALIDALTRENKQLCDENAKLCMRVASLESASEGMHLIREMDVAENAKLRELVQEALASHEKMCTQRGNCFGCQFFDTEWSRACPIVTVIRSARELGIEVGKWQTKSHLRAGLKSRAMMFGLPCATDTQTS